jgi:hypothetical protein
MVIYFDNRAVALGASAAKSKESIAANAIIAVMNVLLYILFIVICVVFQYTEDNSNSVCPGREALKSNDRVQRGISVAYAAFISALSLGISIGFVAFGSRIVRSFSSTQITGNLKKAAQKVCNAFSLPPPHILFPFSLISNSFPSFYRYLT